MPFNVTISALDQYDEPFTGYIGVNTLVCSGWAMSPTVTDRFIDGVWTGEVTIAGSSTNATITTVSQSNSSWTGTSNTFNVDVLVEAPSIVLIQTRGGPNGEGPSSLVVTSDGGYAMAGNKNDDFWLAKISASGGNEWIKNYHQRTSAKANSLVQTSDGGYVIAGRAAGGDFLLVKIDASGDKEWSETYGGEGYDAAWSLVVASDGGYAIVGETDSFGLGGRSAWLVKTDEYGNMEWNQTYGGTEWAYAYSLVVASDGGYAITGSTAEIIGGTYPSYIYDRDFWLIKTDKFGNIEWTQSYGGPETDVAYSLVETSDGGYAIAGRSHLSSNGTSDFWLVKTDAYGNMLWSQTYGGIDNEIAYSLVETSDGGYAIAGHTESFGAGDKDFWLVKTDGSGNMEWHQTYGGTESDQAYSVVEISDGEYALAGFTESFGEASRLVRTD